MVDVRGDVLRPPHGTTPAAAKASWYSCLNNSSKLSAYRTVKTQFYFEKYLTKHYKQRISLSRLRCLAHKLMVEDGSFRNIERRMRLCLFCNMNMVEDVSFCVSLPCF